MKPKIVVIPPEDPALVRKRDGVREHDPVRYRSPGAGPKEEGGSEFASSHAPASFGYEDEIESELLYGEDEQQFTQVSTARGTSKDGTGYRDAGMFALTPTDDEPYLNVPALITGLGVPVTEEQLLAIYGKRAGGPLRADLRELRSQVDKVLALIADADISLAYVARELGVNPRVLQKGAARAEGG